MLGGVAALLSSDLNGLLPYWEYNRTGNRNNAHSQKIITAANNQKNDKLRKLLHYWRSFLGKEAMLAIQERITFLWILDYLSTIRLFECYFNKFKTYLNLCFRCATFGNQKFPNWLLEKSTIIVLQIFIWIHSDKIFS